MSDTQILNHKVGEELDIPEKVPSNKEKEVVASTFTKFRGSADSRNQNFNYLDGRNLIDYINDSVRRFSTNIDMRDGIEDWQARVFDPFTRNKVIAILGKIAAIVPKPEYIAVGDEDYRRAGILGDLVGHADQVDDADELMFYGLLEATVKGTMIGYEGYEEKIKAIRDIQEYDSGDKVKIIEGKKIIRKLIGQLVPLEDFYPSSAGVRKIKDMPYCSWRSLMDYSQFAMSFAQYAKAKVVQPHSAHQLDAERPYYADYISGDVTEGQVEVIRFYNQDTDEFVIIANGIWLNPLGGEQVSPIPFIHKSLPFWSAIYEPFGSDFFYGKSIPDKLKAMQDVINVLHNMMLDQGFLSIFRPILVEGIDEIEDDFLRPGRRIPVTNPQNYKELEVSTPNGFHQFILDFTKRTLEESSVDSVSQGIAGTGSDRTTATEVERAAQAVGSILGLFVQFVKWGVRDRARLRGKNALQFYTAPLMEKILGEGGAADVSKAFNTIKVDDTILTSGKRGMRVIELYQDENNLPTKTKLMTDSVLMEKELKKPIEKVAISKDYIRDFEFDVKLVANPSANESKALQKAMFMEYSKFVLEAYPDMVDREQLFAESNTMFGYLPNKFMKKKEAEQPLEPGQPLSGAGNVGIGQNLINKAAGGSPMAVSKMVK